MHIKVRYKDIEESDIILVTVDYISEAVRKLGYKSIDIERNGVNYGISLTCSPSTYYYYLECISRADSVQVVINLGGSSDCIGENNSFLVSKKGESTESVISMLNSLFSKVSEFAKGNQ